MRHYLGPILSRVKRPPLRTCAELAEELGVPTAALAKLMANAGIRPKLDNRAYSAWAKVCWYDPVEVRRWWRERPHA